MQGPAEQTNQRNSVNKRNRYIKEQTPNMALVSRALSLHAPASHALSHGGHGQGTQN